MVGSEHTLGRLLQSLPEVRLPDGLAELRVRGLADDSRRVRPGDVFVAVRGQRIDGASFIDDAIGCGAAAIITDSDASAAVPVVRVPDTRAALAAMAAAYFGRPADRLRLVGITGTIGKTTILQMLSEALTASGIACGAIGSLGIRVGGRVRETINTTPGTLDVQASLARMVQDGAQVAAMEVTSHALVQQRVRGIRYDLGIFTNLMLLEHLEYHGSFRAYVEAKARFLEHLEPDAPLIHPSGDRMVRELVRGHAGPRIACGGGRAAVTVRRGRPGMDCTELTLTVHRELPRIDGGVVRPQKLPLRLRTPGRPHTANATLATVAALCLGADAAAVRDALARMPPPRRRMQIVHRDGPIIIDDTVGHPDSITAVFEVAARLRCRRLHVVFGIRGRRGREINARDAESLAIWHRRVPIRTLIVTSAADTADGRNTVSQAERRAFHAVLRRCGVAFAHIDRLGDAVPAALDRAGPKDLVLLLGAQGMDAAAAIVHRTLRPG